VAMLKSETENHFSVIEFFWHKVSKYIKCFFSFSKLLYLIKLIWFWHNWFHYL